MPGLVLCALAARVPRYARWSCRTVRLGQNNYAALPARLVLAKASEHFGDLVPVLVAGDGKQAQKRCHGWKTSAHWMLLLDASRLRKTRDGLVPRATQTHRWGDRSLITSSAVYGFAFAS
jgi:hypothetical protein